MKYREPVYDEVECVVPGLEGPCHVSRHAKIRNGYSTFVVEGKQWLVHRHVWTHTRGPIPEGMVIDHRCRVRACCNVNHLRVVTLRQNSLENNESPWAKNAARTHCPNGHEYTVENTKRKGTSRECRTCIRRKDKRRRDRKKA